MSVNWELALGFNCPEADIEALTVAIMRCVGEKTSSGKSTVWGIQNLQNDQYLVRFREASSRDLLLSNGGFTFRSKFYTVFRVGGSMQWLLLTGIPVALDITTIKSVLQQYGTLCETIYETLQGFNDVYSGNLRILVDVKKQVPESVVVAGFTGQVICLGLPHQVCGMLNLNATVANDSVQLMNYCEERTSHHVKVPTGASCCASREIKAATDYDDLTTDSVPIDSPLTKIYKTPELYDELRSRRYNSMGAAMAWGFFIYLRDTAFKKKLNSRIQVYEDSESVQISIQKLIILVPLSSYKPSAEQIIKHAQNLREVKEDVAGTVDRSYHLSVYKMGKGEDKTYFIPEMAQCLDTLDTMRKECKNTGMTRELQELIREQFVQVLEYLLYNDRNCRGKYEIFYVEGNDAAVANTINLIKEKKDQSQTTYQPNISRTYRWKYDNFGVGLANWFYYNYLKLILPDLPNRAKKWREDNKCILHPKLIILVPKTCFTEDTLHEDHGDIEKATALDDIVIDAGTTKGRKYSVTVYKVNTDEQSHIKYCMPEYATPIRQLYKMREVTYDHRISDAEKDEARDDFVRELTKLLASNVRESRACEVISFDDDDRKVVDVLKELLIAESQQYS